MRHLSLVKAAKAFKEDPSQCPWCENPGLETLEERHACGDVIRRVTCNDCGGTLRIELSVTAATVVKPPSDLLLPGDRVRFLTVTEARALCGKPDEDGDFLYTHGDGIHALTAEMLQKTKGMRYRVRTVGADLVNLGDSYFATYGIQPWMLKKANT